MATYECPGQRSVSMGEHLEGYGVVIGVDDMPAELRLDETMSITDELRRWANGLADCSTQLTSLPPKHLLANAVLEDVLSIADRIDEEHEKGCTESWMRGHDVWASVGNEGVMAERGWVRLPVDDDGEVVRVGSLCKVYPFNEPAKRVRALRVSEFGWFVIFEDGTEEQRYRIRVYKPPTVEDVLLEACNAYHGLLIEGMSDVAHDMPAPSEIIAEYAKRLQLKENA